MYDQTTTIQKFLDAAGAKQPTPGGGAVTALAAALAASMGEMVTNYSVGRKGSEAHEKHLKTALAEFQRARAMLLELMAEDGAAYESFSAARKEPKNSPKRREAVEACIRVPQSVAATTVAVLDLSDKLVDIANLNLLSDLAVCAELAMSATRCAIYNVRVNIPEVEDAVERARIESINGQLFSRAIMLIQKVVPRIWQRVSRPK